MGWAELHIGEQQNPEWGGNMQVKAPDPTDESSRKVRGGGRTGGLNYDEARPFSLRKQDETTVSGDAHTIDKNREGSWESDCDSDRNKRTDGGLTGGWR